MFPYTVALYTFALFLAGPAVIALKEVLGCRVVTVGGSLLVAIGMFSSAFASSIAHLYITFGIIAGKTVS